MEIELSNEELEMLEVSVKIRLQTWGWILEYLKTGKAEGMIEECHKDYEARWVISEYQALLDKIISSR